MLGTRTDEGYWLVKLTVRPPSGAGPLRLTVPTTMVSPFVWVGSNDKLVRWLGIAVTWLAKAEPPDEAEILAVTLLVTGTDATWNVAVDEPFGIVTRAGTNTLLWSLER